MTFGTDAAAVAAANAYARSADLVNWQTIAGEPIKLPILLGTKGTIIDPVP